jgi:hypothetical protein
MLTVNMHEAKTHLCRLLDRSQRRSVHYRITLTVYSMPAVPAFSLGIFDPDAAPPVSYCALAQCG